MADSVQVEQLKQQEDVQEALSQTATAPARKRSTAATTPEVVWLGSLMLGFLALAIGH